MAAGTAASEVAAAISSVLKSGQKRPPEGVCGSGDKEHALVVTLEVDIEAVAALVRLGGHPGADGGFEEGEHRIDRIGILLVGEVHTCDEALHQPAGEDRYLDVRCEHEMWLPGYLDRPGLERSEAVPPVGVGERPGKPGPSGLDAGRVPAVWVRLEELEQRVGHRGAGTVDHPAGDEDLGSAPAGPDHASGVPART